MRNALVVAWKEFKTFFQTPIGYVILVVFTLFGGWFFFAVGCFEPAVMDKMFGRPPFERPGAISYGTYETMLATLETALTPGPWILGDRFSAADVFVGSQLHYAVMTKAIEPTPVMQKYVDRVAARPALQKLLKGA